MPVDDKEIVDVRKAIEQMGLDPKRAEKFLATLAIISTYEQRIEDEGIGIAMSS